MRIRGGVQERMASDVDHLFVMLGNAKGGEVCCSAATLPSSTSFYSRRMRDLPGGHVASQRAASPCISHIE